MQINICKIRLYYQNIARYIFYQNLYNFFDNELSNSTSRYITGLLCSGRSIYTESTKSFYKKTILTSMPVARSIAPYGGSAPRGVLSKAFLCTKNLPRDDSAYVRMVFFSFSGAFRSFCGHSLAEGQETCYTS